MDMTDTLRRMYNQADNTIREVEIVECLGTAGLHT